MDDFESLFRGFPSDMEILDVGTGAGDFIEYLKKYLRDYKSITGIDNIERAVEMVNKHFADDTRIKAVLGNAEELVFKDNTFDMVCISNTIHHLPNKDKVLSEMKRVLKPGGIFIVNEMICDGQSLKQMSHVKIHHLQGEIDTAMGICHNKTYTTDELVKIGDSLGLKKLSSIKYNTNEEQEALNDTSWEKDALEGSFKSMHNRIEQIKDKKVQDSMLAKLKEYENTLYDIGIFGATEFLQVYTKYL